MKSALGTLLYRKGIRPVGFGCGHILEKDRPNRSTYLQRSWGQGDNEEQFESGRSLQTYKMTGSNLTIKEMT